MWDGCLGHHEHWAYQHIVAPVQIFNCTRVDVTCTCGSSVVDEDVKATEMFHRFVQNTFYVFLYCYVAGYQEYLNTTTPYLDKKTRRIHSQINIHLNYAPPFKIARCHYTNFVVIGEKMTISQHYIHCVLSYKSRYALNAVKICLND